MTNEEILTALQVAELTRDQPKLLAIHQLVLMELDVEAETARKTVDEKLAAKKEAEAKAAEEAAKKAEAEAKKASGPTHTSSNPLPRF